MELENDKGSLWDRYYPKLFIAIVVCAAAGVGFVFVSAAIDAGTLFNDIKHLVRDVLALLGLRWLIERFFARWSAPVGRWAARHPFNIVTLNLVVCILLFPAVQFLFSDAFRWREALFQGVSVGLILGLGQLLFREDDAKSAG